MAEKISYFRLVLTLLSRKRRRSCARENYVKLFIHLLMLCRFDNENKKKVGGGKGNVGVSHDNARCVIFPLH